MAGGLNTYVYVGANPVGRIDPSGLDWIYHQSTGELYHQPPAKLGGGPPAYIGQGYAGIGEGLNSPPKQNVPNVGPLPQGEYTIGPQGNHGKGGRLKDSMFLDPYSSNNMFTRHGFFIHGAHNNDQFDSSDGCIVMKKSIRDEIAKSRDKVLRVEP